MDELLAFLSDADAGTFPTIEEHFGADKESLDARAAPRLALEYDPITASLEESGEATNAEENDEHGDSAGSSSPETTSRAVERAVPPKRRTNKDELALLRAQVEHLTTHLNALKTSAGIGIGTPIARVPAAQVRALVAAATNEAHRGIALWKELAVRQLARRQASEQENRALLEAVKQQTRRAKRLRLMLQKRALRAVRASFDCYPKALACLCWRL